MNIIINISEYQKARRKMGALHHFSASAVAREGTCEGARGCLLMVAQGARKGDRKWDHFAVSSNRQMTKSVCFLLSSGAPGRGVGNGTTLRGL